MTNGRTIHHSVKEVKGDAAAASRREAGRRLRLARTAAGLSLRGLAGAIGRLVSAQALNNYEHGESLPRAEVLQAVAAALRVPESYLAGAPEQALALTAVAFRSRAVAGRRAQRQVEAQVLRLLEGYAAIEALLRLPAAAWREWDRPAGAPYPVTDLDAAEQGAREIRRHWGLGNEPIPDLGELLEGHGVKVVATTLGDDVDGLLAYVARADGRKTPAIVVHDQVWGERQRFTMAHELGHLALTPDGVDAEHAAYRFAGEFLMPATTLRAEVGMRRTQIGWGELFHLKRLFGVSVQAITYRCRVLGIFGQPLYRRLYDDYRKRGWLDPPYQEPYALPKGTKPRRFERLCLRALAEGAISGAKAAELLGVALPDLRRLMEEPPGARHDAIEP